MLSKFRKDVFRLSLYCKWINLFVIVNIISGTICLSFCMLCFQIFNINLILRHKKGLTYTNSTVNWIFGKQIVRKYFFFFFFHFKRICLYWHSKQVHLHSLIYMIYRIELSLFTGFTIPDNVL